MKRWHWLAPTVVAAVWLVVTMVRAAVGVPGHTGLGNVFLASACVLLLGVVAVFMFRTCATMIAVIWRERWDWLMSKLRPNRPRTPVERKFHSGVDGVGYVIGMVILEVGIYWFALLSGYGVLLCVYILGSLAWNGDVALTTVRLG